MSAFENMGIALIVIMCTHMALMASILVVIVDWRREWRRRQQ